MANHVANPIRSVVLRLLRALLQSEPVRRVRERVGWFLRKLLLAGYIYVGNERQADNRVAQYAQK